MTTSQNPPPRWSRASGTARTAHATIYRDAVCGTPMGYGQFSQPWELTPKCKRCIAILARLDIVATDD